MNDDDRIDDLIGRSSLGAPMVKLVRSLTPPELADAIVTCAEQGVRIFESDPTYQAAENQNGRPDGPERKIDMSKELTPGTTAPRSGQYQERGPRGGAGREVTVVRGEPLPPTTKPGSSYTLVDPTKNKAGRS